MSSYICPCPDGCNGCEVPQFAKDEIERLHAAAREVIGGQQDRHKHSSGQVFVDVGSLDALERLLPPTDPPCFRCRGSGCTECVPECDHSGAFKPEDNERIQWGDLRMCPTCLSIIYPDGAIFMTFPPSAAKAEVEACVESRGREGG